MAGHNPPIILKAADWARLWALAESDEDLKQAWKTDPKGAIAFFNTHPRHGTEEIEFDPTNHDHRMLDIEAYARELLEKDRNTLKRIWMKEPDYEYETQGNIWVIYPKDDEAEY